MVLGLFVFGSNPELLGRWGDRSRHTGNVYAHVVEAVIQELDDVLVVVGKRAGIFSNILVVVGSSQQARRPGSVAIAKVGLIRIRRTICVRVDEVVWVSVRFVNNRYPCGLSSIGLDSLEELLLHGLDLHRHTLAGIAIAIIVNGLTSRIEANAPQVFFALNTRVTGAAAFHPHGQSVDIMALRAKEEGFHVLEETIVSLSSVLIGTLGLGAKAGCSSGEVVRVAEAEIFRNLIVTHTDSLYDSVDADGGFATLVAIQTQVGVRIAEVQRGSAWEGDRTDFITSKSA